jgi:hypothetical protein
VKVKKMLRRGATMETHDISAVLSGLILFGGREPGTVCRANFRLSLPGR